MISTFELAFCNHVVSKCTHIGIKLLSGIENLALVFEPQSLAGLRRWREGVGRPPVVRGRRMKKGRTMKRL